MLRHLRRRQQIAGFWSALILSAAILAMLDGLQAVVRGSAYQLDLIPGEREEISGPCPSALPKPSDLVVRIEPEGAPIRFLFDDFYASYWTGTGMWRGAIAAEEVADRQRCTVHVSFRNAPVKALEFIVLLWEDAAARQAAALSWVRRYSGLNPFLAALGLGLVGLACGLVNFTLSRRTQAALRALGLNEIFRVKRGLKAGEDTTLWCLPFQEAPRPGEIFAVTDATGRHLGEARARIQGRAALELRLIGDQPVMPGCMVRRMGDTSAAQ